MRFNAAFLFWLFLFVPSIGQCQDSQEIKPPAHLENLDWSKPFELSGETDLARKTWIRQYNALLPFHEELLGFFKRERLDAVSLFKFQVRLVRLRLKLAETPEQKQIELERIVYFLKVREEFLRIELSRPMAPGGGHNLIGRDFVQDLTDVILDRVAAEEQLSEIKKK